MYDLIASLPSTLVTTAQELGPGNMIVLFGMVASLVTPLWLSARRMDRR